MVTSPDDQLIAVLVDISTTIDLAVEDCARQIADGTARLRMGPLAGPARERELEMLAHHGRQLEHWHQISTMVGELRLETHDIVQSIDDYLADT